MSIYSNLKELYKDTNDIVNGKNIAWKIIYIVPLNYCKYSLRFSNLFYYNLYEML